MTLTYFYSYEIPECINLKRRILALPIVKEFKIRLIDSNSDFFNQLEFLIACHRDDIVIVDCTIPFAKNQKSVYPILVAQVNMLDHVLVVSNNMLPLNIVPQRQGYDSPRLGMKFSKEKQLKWIERQIKDLHQIISMGKHYDRIYFDNYMDIENKRPQMERMWLLSDAIVKGKEAGKKKILISYRSSHYEDVVVYKKEYEKCHPNEIVRMVEPGILCTGEEALTPMRKWMLVFMLEEKIHDIDELIIYKTDDYTDSWWTCAEIIMVAYNNYCRKENEKIIIKYYDANNPKSEEQDAKEWLNFDGISESQRNRLARLAANTRPESMGPECMSNIGQMRDMCESLSNSNFIFKKIKIWCIKQMLKKSLPSGMSDKEQKEILNKTIKLYTDKQELNLYLADEVFQESFWNELSFQTKWPTPAFSICKDLVSINVDYFLNAPMDELISVSLMDIKEELKNKVAFIIKDKQTNEEYSIKPIDDKRYLWLATRMGQETIINDNAPGLEIIPIYMIKNHK